MGLRFNPLSQEITDLFLSHFVHRLTEDLLSNWTLVGHVNFFSPHYEMLLFKYKCEENEKYMLMLCVTITSAFFIILPKPPATIALCQNKVRTFFETICIVFEVLRCLHTEWVLTRYQKYDGYRIKCATPGHRP